MSVNALFSLIPPSILKDIGTILLLIGLSGEVAILVVRISKQTFERRLALIFAAVVLMGVGLEFIADRPRTLDVEAQKRLSENLKRFAGTPFDFLVQLDPESVALMESLADALTAAGWIRKPVAGGFGFRSPGKPVAGVTAFAGLEIQITDSKQSQWGLDQQAATVLWHSLQRERLTVSAKHFADDQETPDAIHIKVGAKP
jgi:hypothetical protein